MQKFAAVIVLALCLCTLSRAAPSSMPDGNFQSYMASPGYLKYLEIVFNQMETPPLKAQCPTLKLSGDNFASIIVPPTYGISDGLRHIESGKWIAHVYFDACGKKVSRRALLEAVGGPNHVVEPIPLLPGDFRGDLRLEGDARRIVGASIMAQARCKDWNTIYVLDIVSPDPRDSEKWRELWTSQACGTVVKTDVTYDGRGGAGISITAGAHSAQ